LGVGKEVVQVIELAKCTKSTVRLRVEVSIEAWDNELTVQKCDSCNGGKTEELTN
jgi:hypothetical protein